MVQLTVKALGTQKINVTPQPVFDSWQPLVIEVMVYILTHAPVTRAQIVNEFWPDRERWKANNAFYQVLSTLKRLLGTDFTVSDRKTYTISPEVDLNFDADQFLGGYDYLQYEPVATFQEWEVVADLYKGDFLADMESVHPWVEQHRRMLRDTATNVFFRTAKLAPTDVVAMKYLKRAREISPSREDVALLAMQTRVRLGDKKGALKLYDNLEQALLEQFSIAPANEISAYAESLRAEE